MRTQGTKRCDYTENAEIKDGTISTDMTGASLEGSELPSEVASGSSPAVEFSRAQLSNPLHDCALGSGGAHQPRQKLMLNH